MGIIKKLDEKFNNSSIWQFVKFNLVSTTITIVQLLLANLLPLVFDSWKTPLPQFLRGIFDPAFLFPNGSKYVVDGAVVWGYVMPFFLSNFIANIYGYFVNMKTTFRGKGTKAGLVVYMVTLFILILFTTWLQGYITGLLANTSLASLSRTIAALAAGMVQVAVIFPLEKFVLFKEE